MNITFALPLPSLKGRCQVAATSAKVLPNTVHTVTNVSSTKCMNQAGAREVVSRLRINHALPRAKLLKTRFRDPKAVNIAIMAFSRVRPLVDMTIRYTREHIENGINGFVYNVDHFEGVVR
ncbi:hypothetical protein PVT68_10735 [Microbulbifer bruguierae]|uniref:Uncharacterized protein n=1 Tax=Microbulbifer bruguierae TaxID=3029061 RepID=A0ABY8N8M4_9GAMM|nr:hypothetical protein [Microbulbifer bruguierae]WGL15246.1 hypothetical protein PVT68_10735 [Microbulbifer bruguierae]